MDGVRGIVFFALIVQALAKNLILTSIRDVISHMDTSVGNTDRTAVEKLRDPGAKALHLPYPNLDYTLLSKAGRLPAAEPHTLQAARRAPLSRFMGTSGWSNGSVECVGAAVYVIEKSPGLVLYVGTSMALRTELNATVAALTESVENMTVRYLLTPGWTHDKMEQLKEQWVHELGVVLVGDGKDEEAKWKVGMKAVDRIMNSLPVHTVHHMFTVVSQISHIFAEHGIIVVDGALPQLPLEVALRGLRHLQASGRTRQARGRTYETVDLELDPGAPVGFALEGVQSMDAADRRAAGKIAFTVGNALLDLPKAIDPENLAKPKKLQLAYYKPGARDPRRLDDDDSLPGVGGVTSILYLNTGDEWEPLRDGGCLRLWAKGANQHQPMEVVPKAGRLVLIQTQAFEYEVARTSRERWAVTAWMHKEA